MTKSLKLDAIRVNISPKSTDFIVYKKVGQRAIVWRKNRFNNRTSVF